MKVFYPVCNTGSGFMSFATLLSIFYVIWYHQTKAIISALIFILLVSALGKIVGIRQAKIQLQKNINLLKDEIIN